MTKMYLVDNSLNIEDSITSVVSNINFSGAAKKKRGRSRKSSAQSYSSNLTNDFLKCLSNSVSVISKPSSDK